MENSEFKDWVCPFCGREPEAVVIRLRTDYPTWRDWPKLYTIECEDCGKKVSTPAILDEVSIRSCLVQIWYKATMPLKHASRRTWFWLRHGRLSFGK